jgi:hypothetical protein
MGYEMAKQIMLVGFGIVLGMIVLAWAFNRALNLSGF